MKNFKIKPPQSHNRVLLSSNYNPMNNFERHMNPNQPHCLLDSIPGRQHLASSPSAIQQFIRLEDTVKTSKHIEPMPVHSIRVVNMKTANSQRQHRPKTMQPSCDSFDLKQLSKSFLSKMSLTINSDKHQQKQLEQQQHQQKLRQQQPHQCLVTSSNSFNSGNLSSGSETSRSSGNYLIKYPRELKSSKSSILDRQAPPIRTMSKPVLSTADENVYDEIDAYENISNDKLEQMAHSNYASNRATMASTSKVPFNSGNLLQQFSSKINCFRNSQRKVKQPNCSDDEEMASAVSTSRIVFSSPRNVGSRYRILSKSPKPCNTSLTSSISSASNFSRSSIKSGSESIQKFGVMPTRRSLARNTSSPVTTMTSCGDYSAYDWNDQLVKRSTGTLSMNSDCWSSHKAAASNRRLDAVCQYRKSDNKMLTSSVSANYNLSSHQNSLPSNHIENCKSSFSLDDEVPLSQYAGSLSSSASSSSSSACSYSSYGHENFQQGDLKPAPKTSPFPHVPTCFVAQIKNLNVSNPYAVLESPNQPTTYSVLDQSLTRRQTPGNIKSNRYSYEPIYENLPTACVRDLAKQYSVNDVLHSLKTLESSQKPHACVLSSPSSSSSASSSSSSSFSSSLNLNTTASPSYSHGGSYQPNNQPSHEDSYDDDSLCDEEVEFYLNRPNPDSYNDFGFFQSHQPKVTSSDKCCYFSSNNKPIALWEQLV